MQVGAIIRLLLAVLALSAATQSAHAQLPNIFCNFENRADTQYYDVALQISTLTVPRDMPVGGIIYTQPIIQPGPGVALTCGSPTADRQDHFEILVASANTGINTGAYAGKIYETNVPGIGGAWYIGAGGVGVLDASGATASPIRNGCVSIGGNTCRMDLLRFPPTVMLALIKTGPVKADRLLPGLMGFPAMFVGIANTAPTIHRMVSAIKITGAIQIVEKTCTTSNVSVPLGKQQLSTRNGLGSGRGSYAPTVNFVIALRGCPGFPGSLAISAPSLTAPNNAGVWQPNTLSLQLEATTVINSTNGVLGLTAGAGAAKGVGVQLLKADGTPMPLFQSVRQNVTLGANTNSIDIPLGARYLQTAAKMTPGTANAVATYTLSYQ